MNSQLSLRKMKVNSKNKTRSKTQIHFFFTNKKENISKSLDQKSVNLILQIEMKTCFVYISFLFT